MEELYEKCPELAKIDVETLRDKYTLVKGHVQSGKTNFMICASSLFVSLGYAVVHLLRDRMSDREQITERFQDKMKNIYLALSNKKSISKVTDSVKESKLPYILFIDEVDFVDSGNKTKKYEVIQDLKKSAYCTFGVSATIMDPIGKENISFKNIILLGTDSKYGVYKGVDKIQMIEIEQKAKYTGSVNSDLFKQDTGLLDFINEFSSRRPISYLHETYPHICLVNICRAKGPCFQAQERLQQTHPKLATIVYNGDGISFRYKNIIRNEKKSISKFLQELKEEGVSKYPHIMIFAGDLAGRSISFVSQDYKWHLTDQRLLISTSCDEPELIQKIRLCGVYKDEIPLKLYTTKKTIDDLRKAYIRQEEILFTLCDSKAEHARTFIESMEMNEEKFGRRSMVKDDKAGIKIKRVDKEIGWDLNTYKMMKIGGIYVPKSMPPSDFFDKLDDDISYEVKMFKKWSREDTKVALFMQELDPDKIYTKKEMMAYLVEKKLPNSYSSFFIRETVKSRGYGKILIEQNGVRLRPELVESFKLYF